MLYAGNHRASARILFSNSVLRSTHKRHFSTAMRVSMSMFCDIRLLITVRCVSFSIKAAVNSHKAHNRFCPGSPHFSSPSFWTRSAKHRNNGLLTNKLTLSSILMTDIRPDHRGVISGLLSLSRNLGLITGASVMGALFTLASTTTDITTARPEAVANGMRITFVVAAVLIVVAIPIVVGSRALGPATTEGHVRPRSQHEAWRSHGHNE
jgi:hypothetical protein